MELPTARPEGASDIPRKTSAERLIAAMHVTCSHDLPNQILSLQSLINLMDMDGVIPPGGAGQEYFQRLQAVAEKTAVMTDFLKAMIRLHRYEPKPREIVLAELFRELMVESRSAFAAPLTWDVRGLSGNVRSDRDLVYPSLGEILKALAAGGAKNVMVASSPGVAKVAVGIVVGGPGLRTSATILEQRCDFLLARERLRVAGVDLRYGPVRVDEASVVLNFPLERP